MEISDVHVTFEREALRHAYGFKGGYLSDLWQTVVMLTDAEGREAVGLGTQSVLWSDPAVFAAHSEAGGNALMFAALEHAAQHARGRSYDTPIDLLDELLPEARGYARRITERPGLRETFVLNALVALDNAAWMLQRAGSFDNMIPSPYREALSYRHDRLASIPSAGYGASTDDLRRLADEGYCVIKVKLGHPGPPEEMLRNDIRRIEEVHDVFRRFETPHTTSGTIPYYFDVNGRYEKADHLRRILDAADRIGALERILLVEEPFPERLEADVSGFGVRIAADESAHTDADARRLMDMGYQAIALKPVAKTVSMTLRILKEAHERGVPCFCADLTVNPILVDWNKAFAARLPPLPGLDVGLLETNGHQYYRDWERLASYHPSAGAEWTEARGGLFYLSDAFFERSGGILDVPHHYAGAARPGS